MSLINWDRVEAAALTSIRRDWPVEKLEAVALEGHPTPVSGDHL